MMTWGLELSAHLHSLSNHVLQQPQWARACPERGGAGISCELEEQAPASQPPWVSVEFTHSRNGGSPSGEGSPALAAGTQSGGRGREGRWMMVS